MGVQDDVTRLLSDLSANKQGAGEALLPLVYEELRSLARYYMSRERAGHTLQTTALVHEAFIRLVGDEKTAWENRAHYFRVAARAMRRVLIDHARHKGCQKEGGGRQRDSVDESATLAGMPPEDLIDLDGALGRLAAVDPAAAEIVELRFFGGLSVEETGEVLNVSPRTVKRQWRVARAWLKKEIDQGGGPQSDFRPPAPRSP